MSAEEIEHPVGGVDILIGMEYAEIQPRQIEANQGLVLFESSFGTGKIVAGKHKNAVSEQMSAKARMCAHAKVTNIRSIKVPPKPSIRAVWSKSSANM